MSVLDGMVLMNAFSTFRVASTGTLYVWNRGVSSQEQGSSLGVVGDCSTLNVRGGVSSLGKSPVRPVGIDNHFDSPQAGNNLVLGVESCVPGAVMEVASHNRMLGKAMCRV